MRVVAIIAILFILGGAITLTWYLTKKECKTCPTPSPCPTPTPCPDCPDCQTCPSTDCSKDCPCPTCPDCPKTDCSKDCPCPVCPKVDCDKECPYVVPDNLTIDLTANPPTAVFLGIEMEYKGDGGSSQGPVDKSALFSYEGLPTLECYLTSGGFQIIQVNGYYDVNKPIIFAQITNVHSPGVYTDNKILPVSVKI